MTQNKEHQKSQVKTLRLDQVTREVKMNRKWRKFLKKSSKIRKNDKNSTLRQFRFFSFFFFLQLFMDAVWSLFKSAQDLTKLPSPVVNVLMTKERSIWRVSFSVSMAEMLASSKCPGQILNQRIWTDMQKTFILLSLFFWRFIACSFLFSLMA